MVTYQHAFDLLSHAKVPSFVHVMGSHFLINLCKVVSLELTHGNHVTLFLIQIFKKI